MSTMKNIWDSVPCGLKIHFTLGVGRNCHFFFLKKYLNNLFLMFNRKVRGPLHHPALHIVQGSLQMGAVEAAAPLATLGQMETPTSTPSTLSSAKLEQTRAKTSAACTLIALYWTRCAWKTRSMRARPAQKQSARRTKNWKSCRWAPPWQRQTVAAAKARKGHALNAAKTQNSPNPRSLKAPLRKARQTLKHGTRTQRYDLSGMSWRGTGAPTQACKGWERCRQMSQWGTQRWAPVRERRGLRMKTSWWSQVWLHASTYWEASWFILVNSLAPVTNFHAKVCLFSSVKQGMIRGTWSPATVGSRLQEGLWLSATSVAYGCTYRVRRSRNPTSPTSFTATSAGTCGDQDTKKTPRRREDRRNIYALPV